MADGPSFLLPGEDAIAVAELLADRFALPFWQFTLSATGANTEALRIARLATGRGSYLAFEGRYHGHADEMLAESTPTGESAEYLGLTPEIQKRAISVAFNDLPTLRSLLETKRFACLIAEPALTNCGLVSPDDGFWAEAWKICQTTGTLLILDETHTQTFAYGGLRRGWNMDCDMLTIGKCLGGGVPIGAYGMTAQLARLMEKHLDRHRGGRVLPSGRHDLCQRAGHGRGARGAGGGADRGNIERVDSARPAAAGRPARRVRAPRPALARAAHRRPLRLLPLAGTAAQRCGGDAVPRLRDDRRAARLHAQSRRVGCDRHRRPRRLLRPYAGGHRDVCEGR